MLISYEIVFLCEWDFWVRWLSIEIRQFSVLVLRSGTRGVKPLRLCFASWCQIYLQSNSAGRCVLNNAHGILVDSSEVNEAILFPGTLASPWQWTSRLVDWHSAQVQRRGMYVMVVFEGVGLQSDLWPPENWPFVCMCVVFILAACCGVPVWCREVSRHCWSWQA